MKRLFVALFIVSIVGCKGKKTEPEPDYALEFLGEYWTSTADGNNSTAQTWVITTPAERKINIEYTIDYTFRNQGKEIKSKDVYTMTNVDVLSPTTFKIDQDAVLNSDGVLKSRRVQGEGVKSVLTNGTEYIGITIKFTDPGATTSSSTDFLEFKKR